MKENPLSHSFSLSELAGLLGGELVGDGSASITGVCFSSQHCKPGDIYVAIPGLKVDGADFIDDAKQKGASAAVTVDANRLTSALPGIVVANPRLAVSRLAATFAGNPSERLAVVGVTGTNGKSTVHWLCSKLLQRLGSSCLRIGTLGITLEGVFDQESLTSPDPLTIHTAMRNAEMAGTRFVSMEVSSHGLDQHRLDDVCFDVGVFTNLTRDHLDYHGSMERYFSAKARLFELLGNKKKPRGNAIINIDNEYGFSLVNKCQAAGLTVWSYGENDAADLRISNFQHSFTGSMFLVTFQGKKYSFKTPAIGLYNAENFTAAFASLLALGLPAEDIIAAAASVPLVPGRLEPVGNSKIGIYVDYAHTPDALENALRALKSLVQGELWVIFGCGGDRDRGKRPMMAKVAEQLADKVVVTSDNPRTENPQAIVNDILSQGAKAHLVEVDRKKAIHSAVGQLKPGDVLLIAGKGHEDYQILGTTKVHFSDQEEAKNALQSLPAV